MFYGKLISKRNNNSYRYLILRRSGLSRCLDFLQQNNFFFGLFLCLAPVKPKEYSSWFRYLNTFNFILQRMRYFGYAFINYVAKTSNFSNLMLFLQANPALFSFNNRLAVLNVRLGFNICTVTFFRQLSSIIQNWKNINFLRLLHCQNLKILHINNANISSIIKIYKTQKAFNE